MSPTPKEIRSEIEELAINLLSAQLALASRPVTVHQGGPLATVSWAPADSLEPLIDFDTFATVADYRRQLGAGHYSLLLADASMLQISYTLKRDEIWKHRLSYHPCPLVLERDELVEAGDLVGYFDSQL